MTMGIIPQTRVIQFEYSGDKVPSWSRFLSRFPRIDRKNGLWDGVSELSGRRKPRAATTEEHNIMAATFLD